MEEICIRFIHDTTTVEIGLVTSSCWQTNTRGGTRPQFVNQTSCNTRGPLRSNLQCTIVSLKTAQRRVYMCDIFSFYGLSTAELPWRQVIDRSAENSVVRDRIKALDIIVWDENSMSSQRMFELVNFLHHELANDDCKNRPFAGKQMVLIGEFLQLQPVPNLFDEGRFMFYSPLFDFAISHRFGLTTVIRQQNPELAALAEIREGGCSIATEQYLTSLQRQLPWEPQRTTTQIYFRKVPVQLVNRRQLDASPGLRSSTPASLGLPT